MSVPDGTFSLGRDSPALVEAAFSNLGNTVLNVSLSIDGMVTSGSRIRNSWTVVFSSKDFSITPGNDVIITAKVWPPELEPVGSQRVTSITADVDGISRPFESRSLTFKVQTIFDLRSNVNPMDYQKIVPGESVQFVLALENWAIDYDTVSLSEFEKPAGWDLQFNDSMDPTTVPVTIDPEGERIFHPVIFTPKNALAGKQKIILRAEGISNVTYIELKVEIARKDSFDLQSLTTSGSDNTYKMTVGENLLPVKVVNGGNFFDNVTIEIESAPSWSPLYFQSVVVGSGSNESTVSGSKGLNISDQFNRRYTFEEDTLSSLTVTFDPSQTATVYLRAEIPLGALADPGVVTLKYRYGIFQEQKVLESAIKLILADMEILDSDGDGGADLDVYPLPDYELGDKIHFSWTLKNNYPYETSGLQWSIELSGKTLIEGSVPPMAPGESMDFNETWKADRSTKYYNVATLKISGDVYPQPDKAPSASTVEKIYVDPGPGDPPYLTMVLFGSVMLVIIIGFVGFYIWVRRDLENKEALEREKYESVYGVRERPALGSSEKGEKSIKARSLGKGERPGLPASSTDEKKGTERRGKPGKRRSPSGDRDDRPAKRKASSLNDLGSGDGSMKSEPSKKSRKKKEDLQELEELEEMEEL
jgi:hypothetical protein